MLLTDAEVRYAKPKKKAYMMFDEDGLRILITRKGYKYWRYRYTLGGKAKTMSLGVYPAVSLKEVRIRHAEAQKMVEEGVCPMAKRKEEKRIKREEARYATPVLTWGDQGGPNAKLTIERLTEEDTLLLEETQERIEKELQKARDRVEKEYDEALSKSLHQEEEKPKPLPLDPITKIVLAAWAFAGIAFAVNEVMEVIEKIKSLIQGG